MPKLSWAYRTVWKARQISVEWEETDVILKLGQIDTSTFKTNSYHMQMSKTRRQSNYAAENSHTYFPSVGKKKTCCIHVH